MLLIEYVTGIRACAPFSDVILRISRNIAHENRSFRVRLYSTAMKSLPLSLIPTIFTFLEPRKRGEVYIQHLAPDPWFDKVAIAENCIRRGRLIFVQAGMACNHLANLAGSGCEIKPVIRRNVWTSTNEMSSGKFAGHEVLISS